MQKNTKPPLRFTNWQPWWQQAQVDFEVADLLVRESHWGAASFFYHQVIEKSLKALARRSVQIDDLEGVTIDDLAGTTIDDLAVGGKQKWEHDLIRLVELLGVAYRAEFDHVRADLERLDKEKWYEWTRYPEDSATPVVAPANRFAEQQATFARTTAESVLKVAKRRLKVS